MRKLFLLWHWIIWGFITLGRSQAENIVLVSFKCRTGNQTISPELFCNGVEDCDDGSDEKYHNLTSNHRSTWQSCINSRIDYGKSCLVERNMICRELVRCANVSPCDVKCDSHYVCDSGKCVFRSTLCNEIDGCPEDHGWSNGHGFKCLRNGIECVLPQQLLHDDVSDCDGGIDLCFGSKVPLNSTSRNEFQNSDNLFRDKCFECLKNGDIIPRSRVCDGVIDCPDLSDECLCEGEKPDICGKVVKYRQESDRLGSGESYQGQSRNNSTGCYFGDVRCQDGTCIPRSYVCDGVKDCPEDERFDYCRGTVNCKDATRYEEKCRCNHIIGRRRSYGTACDGVMDCIYTIPEGKILAGELNTFPEDECEAFCYDNRTWHYNCTKSSVTIVANPTGFLPCDPVPVSSADYNPNVTYRLYYNMKEKCDGIKHCKLGTDEEDCSERYKCDTVRPQFVSIENDQVCDGLKDCKDGSDEAESKCRQKRFRCPALGGKKVNIDSKLVCDFTINCDDSSDEIDCNDGRFYCENGEPLFVSGRQKFDGRGDCSDWSDECPLLDKSSSTNVFSSRYEMIANPILRALVWIVGMLSIAGNAAVLYTELKNLQNIHNVSSIAIANRLLIVNLAASDLIMGVYLIAIGIAGVFMQGAYCSQDLLWRSSSSCTIFGVLSVISSETSVITLILLTSCRLYAVIRPFKSSSRPRKRVVCLMILMSWIFALTIAFLPLAYKLSSTFVTHAQFQHSPYFINVRTSLDSARNLFQELMTYDLKENFTIPVGFDASTLSWDELRAYSEEFFAREHFRLERHFGYYSTDSVCLPKFFSPRADPAWGFSLFVNVFNFCAFVFVASSYFGIYAHSKKAAGMRSSSRGSNGTGMSVLQRKILRLIITDFCCWIPICIMAFAKLGGAEVSNTAYVFAAIVLLPINSALNPLLYSSLLDTLYQKIASKLKTDRFAKSESMRQGTANTGYEMTDIQSGIKTGVSKKNSAESRL